MEDHKAMAEARKKFLADQELLEKERRQRMKLRRTLDIEATLDMLQKKGKLPRSFNRALATPQKKKEMAIRCCIAYMLKVITLAGTEIEPNPPAGKLTVFL